VLLSLHEQILVAVYIASWTQHPTKRELEAGGVEFHHQSGTKQQQMRVVHPRHCSRLPEDGTRGHLGHH